MGWTRTDMQEYVYERSWRSAGQLKRLGMATGAVQARRRQRAAHDRCGP